MGNTISAAKLIRQELKAQWPSVKFSVRSDRNSITIRWEDGPTSAQVQGLTDKYRSGRFDGMIDMYEYTPKSERYTVDGVDVTTEYVFGEREWSPATKERFNTLIKDGYGDGPTEWDLQAYAHREFVQWDATTAPLPTTFVELPGPAERERERIAYNEWVAAGCPDIDPDPEATAAAEAEAAASDAELRRLRDERDAAQRDDSESALAFFLAAAAADDGPADAIERDFMDRPDWDDEDDPGVTTEHVFARHAAEDESIRAAEAAIEAAAEAEADRAERAAVDQAALEAQRQRYTTGRSDRDALWDTADLDADLARIKKHADALAAITAANDMARVALIAYQRARAAADEAYVLHRAAQDAADKVWENYKFSR